MVFQSIFSLITELIDEQGNRKEHNTLWVRDFSMVRTCCESWGPMLQGETENVKRDQVANDPINSAKEFQILEKF